MLRARLGATGLAIVMLLVATSAQEAAPREAGAPKLVVIVVVDQFRADFVELYGSQWSRGLRRLVDNGAVFTNAQYPFGRTATCAGHATISTGTLPPTHGIIDNAWFDRASRKTVNCTDDDSVTPVGIGGPVNVRYGPALLTAPTLGDEMAAQIGPGVRVVALSGKARASVMLAGHGQDSTIALWPERDGVWASSSAYTKAPWPPVVEYMRTHPMSAAYGSSWTRLLPDAAYKFGDDLPGEPAPRVFPYMVTSGNWLRSPSSDAYLGDMAGSLATALGLGRGPTTDLLAIGFSAPDVIGHDYGPHSQEVQDALVRLDATLGQLLDTLDAAVGPNGYVLALSSDHGVSDMPEQGTSFGVGTGRINPGTVRGSLEAALVEVMGKGTYVAGTYGYEIYLHPEVADRVHASPVVPETVARALTAIPGVERVIWKRDLVSATPDDDPVLMAHRRGYHPSRGPDLVVVPKAGWVMHATDADHGTAHAYDTHVPVVFYGSRVKPGRYATSVTPADIAPTLAAVIGITLPRAEGHALAEAIAH